MTARFKSVLYLDLDYTLFVGPWESVVYKKVCEELAEKSGKRPKRIRRLIDRENHIRQKDKDCPAVRAMDWQDIAETVARKLDVGLDADILRLVEANTKPPHSRIQDDADQVLKELKRPDRALVVATKGLEKYQRPILDALGLSGFFDEMLTPDTHGFLKQEKAFYGDWLSASSLHIMVGDDLEDDVFAPHRFGFKTVWKPRSAMYRLCGLWKIARRGIRPDCITSSLKPLPQIVEQFERDCI